MKNKKLIKDLEYLSRQIVRLQEDSAKLHKIDRIINPRYGMVTGMATGLFFDPEDDKKTIIKAIKILKKL